MKTIFVCLMMFIMPFARATTLTVQPSTQTASVGQNVFVDINVGNVADLFAYQFDLTFDPSILSASTITEGSFLQSGGGTSFLPGLIDNAGGAITFNADSLIGPIPGVTGSGTLLVVQFSPIGSGISSIDLANVSLLDSTFTSMPEASSSGSVTVQNTAITPEPSSFLLLGTGICSVAFIYLRQGKGNSVACPS